jgi:putative salt-induced outer membrane protein
VHSRHFLLFAALIVTVTAPRDAGAQAAPAPPPRVEGTAELAFVGTSGNASTSTFGVGGELINRPDRWVLKQRLGFVRNEAEDVLTAESWLFGSRAEHQIAGNPRLSAFGEYDFFRDRFAGVRQRHTATGGIAWKALAHDRATLSIDAGVGYLDERRLTGTDVASGTYSTGTALRWKLSPTAELADDARLIGTFDRSADWRALHTISLTTQLNALFSLKVASSLRFANDPAPGFRRTDTTTSIALVAKFKRPTP